MKWPSPITTTWPPSPQCATTTSTARTGVHDATHWWQEDGCTEAQGMSTFFLIFLLTICFRMMRRGQPPHHVVLCAEPWHGVHTLVVTTMSPPPPRTKHKVEGSAMSQKVVVQGTPIFLFIFLLTTCFRRVAMYLPRQRGPPHHRAGIQRTFAFIFDSFTLSLTTHMNNTMRAHSLDITTILPCMKCETEAATSHCRLAFFSYLNLFFVYWPPISAWQGGNTPPHNLQHHHHPLSEWSAEWSVMSQRVGIQCTLVATTSGTQAARV